LVLLLDHCAMGPSWVSVDEPVENAATHELVVERLRRAIHLGQFVPGDRLPSQRKLAESLSVSRVTVREALRVLQGEGYVESRRGATGGPFVVHRTESADRLRRILRERRAEFEAILEFRILVEGGASRLAAERRTGDDLQHLRAAIEEMRTSDDLFAFRRADSAFHLAIATAAGNPMLRDAIARARAAMFLPMDALEQELQLADWVGWHRQLLAAVEAGDAGRAARAMRLHVERNRSEILALLGVRGKEER
jgi:GntR family transcriptional regulator, transcriptional repressor for pyruvate dehydrogenase complex